VNQDNNEPLNNNDNNIVIGARDARSFVTEHNDE